MQDIFKIKSSSYSLRKSKDLQHDRPYQVTFGSNSLGSLGSEIWNGLPNDMKSAENLNSFKNMIKKWEGQNCNCIRVSKLVLLVLVSFLKDCKNIYYANIFIDLY